MFGSKYGQGGWREEDSGENRRFIRKAQSEHTRIQDRYVELERRYGQLGRQTRQELRRPAVFERFACRVVLGLDTNAQNFGLLHPLLDHWHAEWNQSGHLLRRGKPRDGRLIQEWRDEICDNLDDAGKKLRHLEEAMRLFRNEEDYSARHERRHDLSLDWTAVYEALEDGSCIGSALSDVLGRHAMGSHESIPKAMQRWLALTATDRRGDHDDEDSHERPSSRGRSGEGAQDAAQPSAWESMGYQGRGQPYGFADEPGRSYSRPPERSDSPEMRRSHSECRSPHQHHRNTSASRWMQDDFGNWHDTMGAFPSPRRTQNDPLFDFAPRYESRHAPHRFEGTSYDAEYVYPTPEYHRGRPDAYERRTGSPTGRRQETSRVYNGFDGEDASWAYGSRGQQSERMRRRRDNGRESNRERSGDTDRHDSGSSQQHRPGQWSEEDDEKDKRPRPNCEREARSGYEGRANTKHSYASSPPDPRVHSDKTRPKASPCSTSKQAPSPRAASRTECKASFEAYNQGWESLSRTEPSYPLPSETLNSAALYNRHHLNQPAHVLQEWTPEQVFATNVQLFFLRAFDIVAIHAYAEDDIELRLSSSASRPAVEALIKHLQRKEQSRWHPDRMNLRTGSEGKVDEGIGKRPEVVAVRTAVQELLRTCKKYIE